MKKYRNIIFPIEFNHFTGGMLHSVMNLAVELTSIYNVYILAHKEAEVLFYNDRLIPLKLNFPFVVSLKNPLRTIITLFETKNILRGFKKSDTLIITNNVGSELIISGFGIFPSKYDVLFVSRGGNYLGQTGYLLKKGFNRKIGFVATSRSQSNILQTVGVEDEKIRIIHNGIDVPVGNFVYEFSKSKQIRISIIGYISENKNQILAIKVIDLLIKKGYNVSLNIYGIAFSKTDKIYYEKLLSVIKDLSCSAHVNFCGYESDLSVIYSNTDILLSCSLSEGFGRVVVEAMAFGIPSIGLKQSGGLCDIIDHEINGFLVESSKYKIAQTIEKLINDEQLIQKISLNAIKKYKSHFTLDIMVSKYINLLETL